MNIGSVPFNDLPLEELTSNETICDISSKETESLDQKLRFLIKYGEFSNGK